MNLVRPISLVVVMSVIALLLVVLSSPQRLFEPLLADSISSQAVGGSAIQITLVDLIYFLAILLGVVGKALWDYLNQGLDGDAMSRRVLAIKVALSTIIAIMIYATAINALADSKIVSLAGISVAFQGGFFWQSLFQNLSETMRST